MDEDFYKWMDEVTPEELLADTSGEPHPARAEGFVRIQRPIVSKGVAHISRVLPAHRLEDGSPATKGADGYTKEGYPIIESQATVDRIERLNPTYSHSKDAFDECDSHAEED